MADRRLDARAQRLELERLRYGLLTQSEADAVRVRMTADTDRVAAGLAAAGKAAEETKASIDAMAADMIKSKGEEVVQQLVQRSRLFLQGLASRKIVCRGCLETATVEVNWLNGNFTVSLGCASCERTEHLRKVGADDVQHKSSWLQRKADDISRCPCGREQPSVQMIMVVHQDVEGYKMLLDRCARCATERRCPMTRNGEHAVVQRAGESGFDRSKIKLGPLPDDLSGEVGYCQACEEPMIYDRADSRWRAMVWTDVATLWEDA